MIKRIICILFLIFNIGVTSCSYNNSYQECKKEINNVLSPEIVHLKDTYYYKYFLFKTFIDNESSIRYLFNYIKSTYGDKWILTNDNGVTFEDGSAILNTNYQRFSIDNIRDKFYYIKVNFLKNTPISFIIKKENNQTFLSSDFETLTVNTVQNFLDYAEKDESKKETENYIYILYNKDNQEKMKLKYHDKGAWFEVEIL